MVSNVAVVIRAHNNNLNAAAAVERAFLQGIRDVVLVVNKADTEYIQKFKESLDNIHKSEYQLLHTIELESETYSWSTALNVGKTYVFDHLEVDHVFFVSVGVFWTADDVSSAIDQLHQEGDVVAAGFPLSAIHEGNILPLGPTYDNPRNTAMLVHREAYNVIPEYSTKCDGWGGMEDLLFLVELICKGKSFITMSEKHRLQFKVPHDIEEQKKKEERELKAINQIVSYLYEESGYNKELLEHAFTHFYLGKQG